MATCSILDNPLYTLFYLVLTNRTLTRMRYFLNTVSYIFLSLTFNIFLFLSSPRTRVNAHRPTHSSCAFPLYIISNKDLELFTLRSSVGHPDLLVSSGSQALISFLPELCLATMITYLLAIVATELAANRPPKTLATEC